ncbi:carbonic anhydrase [Corynespora cassiicola Philippines]|uniref:Carbonic anhydrase n=1 Tax=Corynespora cassiicola Philippines TaxID=1448308 RepID=A0A2T2P6M4_CORCC|nr:carbonic anhydrase [Corynespora cassiicola Philippines]
MPFNQGELNMNSGNATYASRFTQSGMALPPSQKYAVLTCMDARIDPTSAFGIPLGAAHVIRNAGGCAKDALRSLVISQQLLGTTEVLIVKHTGCGMLTFDNATARKVVLENRGEAAGQEVENMDFLPFKELEQAVLDDVRWLQERPSVGEGIRVTGWIYNVDEGAAKRII